MKMPLMFQKILLRFLMVLVEEVCLQTYGHNIWLTI